MNSIFPQDDIITQNSDNTQTSIKISNNCTNENSSNNNLESMQHNVNNNKQQDIKIVDNNKDEPIQIRLLLSQKDAGIIIGRRGANIKQLRADFPDALLCVPSVAGIANAEISPERVLTVIASNKNSLAKLIEQLARLLASEKSAHASNHHSFIDTKHVPHSTHSSPTTMTTTQATNTKPSTSRTVAVAVAGSPAHLVDTNPIELKLLIHCSLAGSLIGIGGTSIKKLRVESRAAIKLFSLCCPQSNERIVAIKANWQVVARATLQIVMHLSSVKIKGRVCHYDAANFDLCSSQAYGGFEFKTQSQYLSQTQTQQFCQSVDCCHAQRAMSSQQQQQYPQIVDFDCSQCHAHSIPDFVVRSTIPVQVPQLSSLMHRQMQQFVPNLRAPFFQVPTTNQCYLEQQQQQSSCGNCRAATPHQLRFHPYRCPAFSSSSGGNASIVPQQQPVVDGNCHSMPRDTLFEIARQQTTRNR